MLDRKKFDRWLRQALCVHHEGFGDPQRVELRAMSGTFDDVQSTSLDIIELGDEDRAGLEETERADTIVSAMVEQLAASAQTRADAYGGRQRFIVYAYYKNSTAPGMQFEFLEQGPPQAQLAGLDQGQGGQAQFAAIQSRHNLALIGINLSLTDRYARSLERENDRLTRDNQKFRDDFDDVLRFKEKMISKEHKRALDTKERTAGIDRKNRILRRVEQLAPLLVQHVLSNGEKRPLRAAPDDVEEAEPRTTIEFLVLGLAESLEDEQLLALAPHLDGATMTLFMDLAKATQLPAEAVRKLWTDKYADDNPRPAGDTPLEWFVWLFDRRLNQVERAAIVKELEPEQRALFNALTAAIREKRPVETTTRQ